MFYLSTSCVQLRSSHPQTPLPRSLQTIQLLKEEQNVLTFISHSIIVQSSPQRRPSTESRIIRLTLGHSSNPSLPVLYFISLVQETKNHETGDLTFPHRLCLEYSNVPMGHNGERKCSTVLKWWSWHGRGPDPTLEKESVEERLRVGPSISVVDASRL